MGVDYLFGDNECDLKKANTPLSLMGHFRDIGGVKKEKKGFTPMGCKFHYAIRVYLETLYSMDGDYRGGKYFFDIVSFNFYFMKCSHEFIAIKICPSCWAQSPLSNE